MRNAGLEEAQAGIKIARRNINHLRYADDTALMAESDEELKSLVVFLTFFQLILNFSISILQSEAQLALGVFLLTVDCFSIFSYKEHNQSDFSTDHLVMSMFRERKKLA